MFFRKPQLLKQFLRSSSGTTTKISYPTLNSLSFSFPIKNSPLYNNIPQHFFSSFQSYPPFENNIQQDISLLQGLSQDQKDSLNKALEKYITQKHDLNLLTPDEMKSIFKHLHFLSTAHKNAGNLQKAFEYLLEKDEIFQRAGIKDTYDVALNYSEMASILMSKGKFKEGEKYLNEVDRICQLLGDEDKAVKSMMIVNLHALARVEGTRDKDKALKLFKSILKKIDGVEESVQPELLVHVYKDLGHLYRLRNEVENTIKSWEKAAKAATKHFGEESALTNSILSDLLKFLIREKEYTRAEPYAQKNLQGVLKKFPKDSVNAALAYYLLAKVFYKKQAFTKALDLYSKAAEIFENQPEDASDMLYTLYFAMAGSHGSLGNKQKASEFLAKANQSLIKANGKADLNIAILYLDWAEELLSFRMTAEAEEYYLKALELYQNFEPSNRDRILFIYLKLSDMAYTEANWRKALEFYTQSLKYIERSDPRTARMVCRFLSSIHSKLGDNEKAAILLHKADFFEKEMNMQKISGKGPRK